MRGRLRTGVRRGAQDKCPVPDDVKSPDDDRNPLSFDVIDERPAPRGGARRTRPRPTAASAAWSAALGDSGQCRLAGRDPGRCARRNAAGRRGRPARCSRRWPRAPAQPSESADMTLPAPASRTTPSRWCSASTALPSGARASITGLFVAARIGDAEAELGSGNTAEIVRGLRRDGPGGAWATTRPTRKAKRPTRSSSSTSASACSWCTRSSATVRQRVQSAGSALRPRR